MYQIENSVQIEGFWDYYVTDNGVVYNNRTGKTLKHSPTMHGDMTVGLMRSGRQYRRSVKVLVAKAFVDGETDVFNTPILLDNDRFNLNASNIVWRPRWFAWKYSVQFNLQEASQLEQDIFIGHSIVELTENRKFDSIVEACIEYGLLIQDVYQSTQHHNPVFPTGHIFVFC